MPIKRSTASEVSSLLHDLQAGDEIARQAAGARLAVIGTRAVEGLHRVVASEATPAAKAAALAALEAIGDPRGVDSALAVLTGSDAVLATAAGGVLRVALESPRGDEVLDRLAAVAVDTGQPEHARLAALSALQALPARVTAPVWDKLKSDPNGAVRAAVGPTGPEAEIAPPQALEAASGGALPEDPETLRRWITVGAAHVSLPVLHRLVESSRRQEAKASDPATRIGWMTARAAAHLALAERGSRVALYDLRETIESGTTAPVEMLRALEAIGDRIVSRGHRLGVRTPLA